MVRPDPLNSEGLGTHARCLFLAAVPGARLAGNAAACCALLAVVGPFLTFEDLLAAMRVP